MSERLIDEDSYEIAERYWWECLEDAPPEIVAYFEGRDIMGICREVFAMDFACGIEQGTAKTLWTLREKDSDHDQGDHP